MAEKIPEEKRKEIFSWKYDLVNEGTDKAKQMLKLSQVWNHWLNYAYFVHNYIPEKGLKGGERFWDYMAFIRRFYEIYNICKKEKMPMAFKDFEISPSELKSYRK